MRNRKSHYYFLWPNRELDSLRVATFEEDKTGISLPYRLSMTTVHTRTIVITYARIASELF